jgi:hypothetical protein
LSGLALGDEDSKVDDDGKNCFIEEEARKVSFNGLADSVLGALLGLDVGALLGLDVGALLGRVVGSKLGSTLGT